MDKIIKKIIEKIEDEGFEAYVVGGYVRDFLLGKNTYDIDICTNALPKELHKIFPGSSNSNNYGGFNLKIKQYNIDITTYRKEVKYEKRKPVEIIYINNLLEDLKRRDFTINALCMGTNEKIIDPLNAVEDIHNHQIKMIGSVKEKLKDDPLRILRAIRFATVLDFELDDELLQGIKKNAALVSSLSGTRIKEELNRILLSDNYHKGLSLLKDLGITKVINMKFDEIIKCSDINMMWAQIKCDIIPFTKQEKQFISKLQEIIEIGEITNEVLFKYGLYLCTVVSEYYGINKKIISKMYHDLPIKNVGELAIKTEDIIRLLNITPGRVIKDINNELVNMVINKKLKNQRKALMTYIKQNQRKWQDE